MENQDQISISDFLKFVKTKIILMIAIVVIAFGVGFIRANKNVSTSYTATAKVLVDGATMSEGYITTYQNIITSNNFLENVIKNGDLGSKKASDIKGALSISATTGTSILNISATNGADESTTKLVNAAAAEFVKVANDMKLTDVLGRRTMSNEKDVDVTFSVLESATGAAPSVANSKKTIIIFTLGGVLAALVVVFVLYLLDDHVLSEDSIKNAKGAKLFGKIKGTNLSKVESKIDSIDTKDGKKIVLVAAPSKDRNRDIAAVKLAELFAASEKKTLLINTDLNGSASIKELGDPKEGLIALTDKVKKEADLAKAVTKADAGFDYISIARGEDAKILSAKMLGAKAASLMSAIRAGYDVVVINADSLDKSADAISFAKYSDEEVLIATADRTKNTDLREAISSLAQVKNKEVDVVLFENK